MGIFSIEFLEEINLSGGSAAVALGLIGGALGPWTRTGVDTAVGPPGDMNRIVGAIAAVETASASAGSFTVSENTRSPYAIGAVSGDSLAPAQMWGLNIKIPDKATIAYNGMAGAGAEQNAGVVFVEKPEMEDPWNFSSGSAWDEVISVRPTTQARVLDTISGHTDICGRTTAYTDGQTPIPPSRAITVQVIKIISNDVAGYSGPVLVRPGVANLCFPTAATHSTEYDMMEIFGAYPTCTADDPFDIAGVGVTTAAMTLSTLVLGINYGGSRT